MIQCGVREVAERSLLALQLVKGLLWQGQPAALLSVCSQ